MPFRTRRRLAAAAPLLAAAIFATLAARVDAARADDDAALRSFHTANGLLNRGHHELAAAEYRAFLAANGSHEKALVARYGLGVCLYRLDQPEEAIAALAPLRSAGAFEFSAEAMTILARCELAVGKPEAAAADLETIIERHADHDLADDAVALRAEALYALGNHGGVEEAGALFEQRWPMSDLRDRVELFRGLSEMARGEWAAAADRFGRFRGAFPKSAHADRVLLLHAQSLHQAGRLPQALEQYRAVIAADVPAFVPDATYGLAVLLHGQGRADDAGALLDELLAPDAGRERATDAAILRGRILVERGDHDAARALLEPIARLDHSPADAATYWIAKSHLRSGESREAARRLEQALDRFPESPLRPEMMYDRAVALLREDGAARRQQAAKAGLALLEQIRAEHAAHPLAIEALYLQAATVHQDGAYDASLAMCRRFLADHPSHDRAPAAAFLLAENLFLASAYAEALEAYDRLLETHPDHPQKRSATFRAGMALYHLERFDDAQARLAPLAETETLEPELRTALLALGDVAFQHGDWARSESLLGRYLGAGEAPPAADDALLKLGIARQRQGRPDAALEAYDRLLAEFPKSAHRLQATFERGQALFAAGRRADAEAAFRAVIAEKGGGRFAPHALAHLGAIAMADRRFDEAADLYRRASAQAGEDADLAAEASFQRGQALVSAAKYAPAAEALTAFIEAFPRSARVPTARAHLAVGLGRLDRHDDALAAADRALAEPASAFDEALRASVHYERAWTLRALERPADAAGAYRALIALPKAGRIALHARLELAELEADAGRRDAAADILAALLADLPEDDELHGAALYRLGACEYERERYAVAAPLLRKFAAVRSGDELAPSALLLAGESFHRAGNHEQAIAALEDLLARHPEHETCAAALLRLGDARVALQQWPKARESFALHLERFPGDDLWFQAQFGVAWCLENQGQLDDAIKAYARVVDRHRGPTAARAQFQIGECLYAQRRYEDALRELLRVDILYSYPEWSAAALYEAGRCFQELGRNAEARAHFEQVQRDHAETRWATLAAERLTELTRTGLPGRGGDRAPR
jgi:TolA-binding protein